MAVFSEPCMDACLLFSKVFFLLIFLKSFCFKIRREPQCGQRPGSGGGPPGVEPLGQEGQRQRGKDQRERGHHADATGKGG